MLFFPTTKCSLFSYQWYQYDTQPAADAEPDDTKKIDEATSATLSKAGLDVSKGKFITVVVSPPAENYDYEKSSLATPYEFVKKKLKVTIEEDGNNLKAVVTAGDPAAPLPEGITPTYQWYQYDTKPAAEAEPDDTKKIADATSVTLAKAGLDVSKGKFITVVVSPPTGNNDYEKSSLATPYDLTASTKKKLKVTIEEDGNNLKAVVTAGDPAAPLPEGITPTYQWYQYDTKPAAEAEPDDKKKIADATSATLSKAGLDVSKGKFITVVVSPPTGNNDYESSGLAEAFTINSEPTQCSVIGCKVCIENKNDQCKECYTDYGFVLQGTTCICNAQNGFGSTPIEDSTATGGKKCKCTDDTHVVQNGKCVAPSPSACSEYVSNCKSCNSENNELCEICNFGYGLRGGICTHCEDNGLSFESSTKPCKPKCDSIENCQDCFVETGQLYCRSCQTGFHIDENYRLCVKDEAGKCGSEASIGCLECVNEGSNICSKCDKSKHYKEEPSNEICVCDSDSNTYINECVLRSEVKTECSSIDNCVECTGESARCLKCKEGFGVSGGKCVECKIDESVAGDFNYDRFKGLICPTDCANKYNCGDKCWDLPTLGLHLCFNCKEGYEPDVNKNKYNCVAKLVECKEIDGCSKCYADDKSKCIECDKENHFTNSIINPGTCVCDTESDMINKKCIVPPPPPIPDYKEVNDQKGDVIKTEEGDKQFSIDSSKIVKEDNKIPNINLESFVDGSTIEIPQVDTDLQLTLPQGKSITINPKGNQNVILNCPSGATIKLHADSNNLDIIGSQGITLEPTDSNKNINIGKITIDNVKSKLDSLKSTDGVIKVNELDIFGEISNFNCDTAKDAKFTKVKVEGNSKFTPKGKMDIEEVIVGLQSEFTSKGKDVKVNKYNIKYNSTSQIFYNLIPIIIEKDTEWPTTKSTIDIGNYPLGVLLNEENLTVAQFKGDKCIDECNAYKFNGGADFGSSVCEENGQTCNLIAKKSTGKPPKDDDGLSAGAIAGIVIACVVVVAAIIALLVYFLVIKKKNQATTSTQGDSSIAI